MTSKIEALKALARLEKATEYSDGIFRESKHSKDIETMNSFLTQDRTCGSCKHLYRGPRLNDDRYTQPEILGSRKELNHYSYCIPLHINVSKDFGCNKWEAKDKQ
jgi:hypothetical protein